jgi:hypothetical protein
VIIFKSIAVTAAILIQVTSFRINFYVEPVANGNRALVLIEAVIAIVIVITNSDRYFFLSSGTYSFYNEYLLFEWHTTRPHKS